eukprot:ANDGO_01097.mRNA.1 hypothetical protein AMSG_00589
MRVRRLPHEPCFSLLLLVLVLVGRGGCLRGVEGRAAAGSTEWRNRLPEVLASNSSSSLNAFYLNQSSAVAASGLNTPLKVSTAWFSARIPDFEWAVSMSNDGLVMAVGAPGVPSFSQGQLESYGSVFVYYRTSLATKDWTLASRVTLPAAPYPNELYLESDFGYSVAVSDNGTYIFVAEPQYMATSKNNNQMHYLVRKLTASNSSTWIYGGKIPCVVDCQNEQLGAGGISLALSDRAVFVGAPYEPYSQSGGRIHTFYASSGPSGTLYFSEFSAMKLASPDSQSGQRFGASITAMLDGSFVAGSATMTNKIFIFRAFTSPSTYSPLKVQSISLSDFSVQVSPTTSAIAFDRTRKNLLYVGTTSNKILVFGGPVDFSSSWTLVDTIDPTTATGGPYTECSGMFGRSMSLSLDGNTMVVGARSSRSLQGSACVLARSTTSSKWIFMSFYAGDSSSSLSFGRNVYISAQGTSAVMNGAVSGMFTLFDSGLCAGGYEPASSGSVGCRKCGAGTYSEFGIVCVSCKTGTASTAIGSASPDVCQPCGVGEYAANGGSACLKCEAGQYNDATQQSSCKQCPPGEFIESTGSAFCTPCVQGFYQDRSGQTACKSCGPGATTASSGSSAIAFCRSQPGFYWDEVSATAIPCSPRDACAGGVGDDSCANGYTGRLCSLCQLGFYRDQTGRCFGCPSFPITELLVVCSIIGILVLICIYYPVRVFLQCIVSALAPVINFFQLMAIISSVRVGYGSSTNALFQVADVAMLKVSFLKPECMTSNMTVVQQWLMSFFPVVFLLLILCVLYLVFTPFVQRMLFGREKFLAREEAVHRSRWSVTGMMVSLMSVFFLPLLRLTVLAWDCSKVGDTYVLDAQPDILCYDFNSSSTWFLLMILGCLSGLLLFVSWFAISYRIISSARRCRLDVVDPLDDWNLDSERFRTVFGAVTQDFRSTSTLTICWGVVFQKMCDACVLFVQVFQSDSPLMQCLCIIMVLELYVVPFVFCRPCKHKETANATGILMFCLQLLIFFGLANAFLGVIKAVDENSGPDLNAAYIPVAFWFFLVVFCFCLIGLSCLILVVPLSAQYELQIVLNHSLCTLTADTEVEKKDGFMQRYRQLEGFFLWRLLQHLLGWLSRICFQFASSASNASTSEDALGGARAAVKDSVSEDDWKRYCSLHDHSHGLGGSRATSGPSAKRLVGFLVVHPPLGKSFRMLFQNLVDSQYFWPTLYSSDVSSTASMQANVVVQIFELITMGVDFVSQMDHLADRFRADFASVGFSLPTSQQRFGTGHIWFYHMMASQRTLSREEFSSSALEAAKLRMYISFLQMCELIRQKPRLVRCFLEFLEANPTFTALDGAPRIPRKNTVTVVQSAAGRSAASAAKPLSASMSITSPSASQSKTAPTTKPSHGASSKPPILTPSTPSASISSSFSSSANLLSPRSPAPLSPATPVKPRSAAATASPSSSKGRLPDAI